MDTESIVYGCIKHLPLGTVQERQRSCVHNRRILRALPGADATALVAAVDGVAAAAGAACHSGRPHVSSVLRAMGTAEDLALCTLRLTVGCPTSNAEIDEAAQRLATAALELRGRR